jgi:putative AlgH/UPF0301 family transcriptional regulator
MRTVYRAWKVAPGSDFKLFFSPNLAMANELCLTKDATPSEFKFFQWATIWLPNQLELEYKQKLWLTVDGPVSMFFDDDSASFPLWRKIMMSLPEERLSKPANKEQ